MYTRKGIVYSEAGKILVGENKKGYQFIGSEADFTEKKVKLTDMAIHNGYVTYGGIIQSYRPTSTYADIKADMVKRRFSNDDQIAIMLNREDSEEDALLFTKMQEWRTWSAKVAKAIIQKRDEESATQDTAQTEEGCEG